MIRLPIASSDEAFLFCEVDMAPCYRRMNGSSAEQVFTGFFIRCFFE